MLLEEIVDNSRTDKNTRHCYLPVYNNYFNYYKEKASNVLEVGIANGGSIRLWRDYFDNATIYGVDMQKDASEDLKNDGKIKLFLETNAYDENFVKNNLSDVKFDIILDDGSHKLEDLKQVIKLYLPLLKDDGVLILEDLLYPQYGKDLEAVVPEELRKCCKEIDLRHVKGIYDSYLFIVDKRKI